MNATQAPAPGTLYGVGVGPGSPDLLTLRAVSVLRKVSVVLAAASTKNEYSTALSIAEPHLQATARVARLSFPMTRDKAALAESWKENARIAAAILEGGESAAFLTLGDPLMYSTFGYLMRTLKALYPHLPVEVVPGITSFQAAAAKTGTILCESGETFLLLPGVISEEELSRHLHGADNAAILKAYRTLPAIRSALKKEDGEKVSLFVSRLGLDGETVSSLANAPEKPNYLSLVLATRKNRV